MSHKKDDTIADEVFSTFKLPSRDIRIYFSETESPDDVLYEHVALVYPQRKQELFKLLYYIVTTASNDFIVSSLYSLVIALLPFPEGSKIPQLDDTEYFISFSKKEITLIIKIMNMIFKTHPNVIPDSKIVEFNTFWTSLIMKKDNELKDEKRK